MLPCPAGGVFDQVKDDDGKLPALEPVNGADFSCFGCGAFLIAQCFQGCLYLGAVWRDDACPFPPGLVVIG